MIKKYKIFATLICFGALVSCNNNMTLEDTVERRWKFIIDNNYESAYELYSDGYQQSETLEEFKLRLETAKINTKWQSAKFYSKVCEESICKVVVKLKYKYSFPRKTMGESIMETFVDESWIDKGGEWVMVPKIL